MKRIELEIWEKSPENPRVMEYVGQRKAQEVFSELKHRLESIGMLPDEYFILDREWKNGIEIPKEADIFTTVQYGASEGIYLNVSLSWDDETKRNIKNFITGKTLKESESHLDRMYLVASAINKAFYSSEPHARYVKVDGFEQNLTDTVLHLNSAERQLMIDSLVEMRNNNPQDINAVEQLLRRVVGSITEFVNEVGARPLQISDYDMAVLAIQEGNLAAFNEVFKKQPDRMGDLLICAAARPGKVGLNMTSAILQEAKGISNEAYLTACKNAITTGSAEKATMMIGNADKSMSDLDMGLYGRVIREAIYTNKTLIAREMVKQCTPEQIQASPYLLTDAAFSSDCELALAIAEMKIDASHYASELVRLLKAHNNDWMLPQLYKKGMAMNPNNVLAMQECIKVESVKMGQVLIDQGLNFEQFEQHLESNPDACEINDTFRALKQYWEASNPPAKSKKPLADKLQAAGAKAKLQSTPGGGKKTAKLNERQETK